LTEITYNGSNVLIVCVVGVWQHILDLWCVCTLRRTENTFEPLYVISVKYRLSLPDDGSYVIRNMLEQFLMCIS